MDTSLINVTKKSRIVYNTRKEKVHKMGGTGIRYVFEL